MSEKNTNVTETVEIDQAMGVMPEEVDPGMSVMPGPGVADTPTVIPELDSMFAVALDQLPAYTTTDWKNKPSTATPVTAEIMKKIEQRLVDLTNAYNNQEAEIKTLRDSVSQRLLADVDANEEKISLNDLTKTGLYTAFSPDNAPSAVKGVWVIIINAVLANNVNFRSQILWSNIASNGAWLRSCTSGSWGEWARI